MENNIANYEFTNTIINFSKESDININKVYQFIISNELILKN